MPPSRAERQLKRLATDDTLEIKLRRLSSFINGARTGDRVGAAHMLAVQPPGAGRARRESTEAVVQVAQAAVVEHPALELAETKVVARAAAKTEAEAKVDACISQQPDYPGCMMLKANVLKKLGRGADAQVAYESALKLVGQKPKTPEPTAPPGLPAAATNPPR